MTAHNGTYVRLGQVHGCFRKRPYESMRPSWAAILEES